MVFITLHPNTDITRFINRNESYIVKEGVRTATIRPEGNKDKVVKITGLHPNTRDQAVVKYLSAHGVLNPKERVTHHIFLGEPGSSLLAGKLNGNRSYVMELKIPLGSYHIIYEVVKNGHVQDATSSKVSALVLQWPGIVLQVEFSCQPIWQSIGPGLDTSQKLMHLMRLIKQLNQKSRWVVDTRTN